MVESCKFCSSPAIYNTFLSMNNLTNRGSHLYVITFFMGLCFRGEYGLQQYSEVKTVSGKFSYYLSVFWLLSGILRWFEQGKQPVLVIIVIFIIFFFILLMILLLSSSFHHIVITSFFPSLI